MAKIGSLVADLGLNTARFEAGIKTASRRLGSFQRKMGRAFKRMRRQALRFTKTLAKLIPAVGIIGLSVLVKQSLTINDSLAKTADKLGITTEALGGLQHAAELSGIKTTTLDMALQRMTRRLSEAAIGTGEAQGALKELGLNAQTLAAATPDQAFIQIAGAMKQVENQADRVRLSFKLFDSEGVALVNTLSLGEEGLRKAADEAERFGLAISRADAAKIEEANNAMTRAGAAFRGVINKITIALAPYIETIANMFSDWVLEHNGFKTQIISGSKTIVKAVAKVAKSFEEVTFGLKAISLAGKIFNPVTLVRGAADGFKSLKEEVQDLAKAFASLGGSDDAAIDKFFADLETEATKRAAEIAEKAKTNKVIPEVPAGIVPPDDTLTKDLERLQQSLADRETVEVEAWFKRQGILDEAHSAGLLTDEQLKVQTEQLEQFHQDKLTAIAVAGMTARQKFAAKTSKAQTQQVLGEMLALTNGIAQHSRAAFEINKIAGIANAIINTSQGVTKALATYPPPLSFGMAALVAAAGLGQVAAIRSQSFSGGGGVSPSVGGGTGATGSVATTPNVTQGVSLGPKAGGQPTRVVVNLEGRAILDTVAEASQDGRLTLDAQAVV